MDQLNPYAPPADISAYAPAPTQEGINGWCEAGRLVLPATGARLPDRCVVCNAAAHGYALRKKFYWHHPAVYLGLLVNVIVYAVLAMVLRKTATVSFGLCPKHRAKRVYGLWIGWGGFGLAFCAMLACAVIGAAETILATIAAMVLLPIVGFILARTAVPAKIDERWIWLKVGERFLETFPSQRG
jgi:hypothetical protein